MAETVFPHKDIVKLSHEMAAVIGHGSSDHGEGDWYVKGEKKHLCNIYGLPSCKVHEDMARALSQKGLLEGVRGTPTHIIYDPHTLKEISRAHYMAVSQIEDAIHEAQKQLGKPVTWRSYSKMRETLDEVRSQIEEKDYRKALRELEGFEPGDLENLEAEARSLRQQIVDVAKERLEKAKAAIEAEETSEARNILRDIRKEFRDLDEIEDQAKELLKSLSD